jgi:uncharacterized protein (TIGR00255 family)
MTIKMAIKSMTAFAGAERQIDGWLFSWELRAVNHRYLDVSPRLPDLFRNLEAEIRNLVAARLKRGRLEINLAIKKSMGDSPGLRLETGLLKDLLATARALEALSERPLQPFSALDLMRWPGVLHEAEIERERLAPEVLKLLDEALDRLVAARATEGAQLAELIESRCRSIEEQIQAVRARMPQVLDAIRQKLLARLAELAAKPDPDRLEQEWVYLAQKLDVSEELDRLATHLAETRRALRQNEPAGRRLDFLLQEMNREANTLGSKSADAETTRASVEMKVAIEQMREQVQNVE